MTKITFLTSAFFIVFHIQAQTIQESDTSINHQFDTTLSAKGYDFKYERDSALVNIFKPYFVTDLCEPGSKNHPVYKSFMNRSRALIDEVKKRILNEYTLSKKNNLKKAIESVLRDIDWQNYSLYPEPIYYLSPNVTLYTQGQSIKQYFTLDTFFYAYRLMDKGKFVCMVRWASDKRSCLWSTSPFFSASYNVIEKLGKESVCLYEWMLLPSLLSYRNDLRFGYITNGYLVVADCEQGNYTVVRNDKIRGKLYKEECNTRFIDAVYSSQYGNLRERILSTIELMNRRKKIKPI